MATHQEKHIIRNAGEVVGKGESLSIVGGGINSCGHVEINVEFSLKPKNRMAI